MASSTHRSITVAFVTLTLLTTGLAALVPTTAADHAGEEGVMTVEGANGDLIEILVCKPADASPSDTRPVILHSHGWGGSRDAGCDDTWLSQGWGYVSVSQRGFGNSEGQAHVHDPDFEGVDNTAVIDEIASFSWVETDDPEGEDPVMAAVGGSYGGGYQYLTALLETSERGEPRLDALAPEITWYDLPQSLAPNEVIRSVWVDALYAAGAASVHDGIHQAFAYGLATGQLPDGTVPGVYNIVEDFHENSPVGWVEQGVQLDIPVVMRQGITDNLFNLNQGVHNFEQTLTPDAQDESLFFGYNGGHALPNVLPLGTTASGDPCTSAYQGGWDQLRVDFFQAAFDGDDTRLSFSQPYHLATDGGDCLHLQGADPDTESTPGPIDVAATTTGAGPVQQIPVLEGPATVAGIPTFGATLTSAGVDQRVFLGLAVGATPADAQVLSNNLMPVRNELPALQEDVETELPGVAVDLAEGETLYLTVTPTSDMFAHHGSRAPGGMLFDDVSVTLPVVE